MVSKGKVLFFYDPTEDRATEVPHYLQMRTHARTHARTHIITDFIFHT
ncbi:MAG: hypothetical protein O7C56_02900 [Rickettsia endosymbiont of Ixodes persulcatus]|nr:hypothetical protein [Rickettsia endosymbiont of Ixodes persulcatus]